MAVLAVGAGLVAYAVWPLPTSIDGLCALDGGAAVELMPGATLSFSDPVRVVAGIGLFASVGLLARYRFRRGAPAAAGLGTGIATVVELVQFSAVVGLYPCPYRVAAVDDVLLGTVGALLGWALGLPAVRLLPRGWPAAIPDFLPPGLARRALGHALDVGLWLFGSLTLVAVLTAIGPVAADGPVSTAVLVTLAVLGGLVLPQLRADRCPPGRAAVRLALVGPGPPAPAGRWRTFLRAVLLYGPVVTLFVLGLPWWALVVAAIQGSCALVRGDQAGLADLLAGTRVATRVVVRGGLPDASVRYVRPSESGPGPVERSRVASS
ncbi:VanZ family protein [Nocardiopsis ansamitocini]|nr:VanZ family protein [Nocardiopsis ansamitocini]